MAAIFRANKVGSALIFTTLNTQLKPDKSVVIRLDVAEMREAGYSTDNTLSLSYIKKMCLNWNGVLFCLWSVCGCFWLRSHD